MRRLLGVVVATMAMVLSGAVATTTAASAAQRTGSAGSADLAGSGAGTWAIQPTANPVGSTISNFSGVSCSTPGHCTGVGNEAAGLSSPEHLMAERARQSGWIVQPTALPDSATGGNLQGVSCPLPTICVAVGNYSTRSGGGAFAEVWNGARWNVQSVQAPPGAMGADLVAVSCTSAVSCTAVGDYNNQGGNWALIEGWNGTEWTLQHAPRPAGSVSTRLAGVSCTSALACEAVGYYATESAPVAHTLVVGGVGATWRVQKAPIPAGASFSQLDAVSCVSPSACTAVGSFGDPRGAGVTLAEGWADGTWTILSTPNPAGMVDGQLSSVSCTAATTCVAVGYYTTSNLGLPTELAEGATSSGWSIQHPVEVAGSTASVFWGVSCTASQHCVAAGYSENGSGVFPLAELHT